VLVIGTPTLASYTLLTASSITGTPTLAAPAPTGYELKVQSNVLKLVRQGYAAWASLNGASANLNDDHDSDGVPNGIEYFLVGPDGTSTGFTSLPPVVKALDGTLSVTWTKAATYVGVFNTDFFVETSDTLTGIWTPEILAPGGTVTITGNDVKFTFPGGPAYSGKKFVRLRVTGP
jgi:hypothetical protein